MSFSKRAANSKTYTAKMEPWVIATLVGSLLMTSTFLLMFFSAEPSQWWRPPFTSLFVLPFMALLPGMARQRSYRLNDTALVVERLSQSTEIPLAHISRIRPTNMPFRRGLLIDYRYDEHIVISPKLAGEFMQDIEARRAKLRS